ncbi:34396_t:CDS:2 [Racocetra persica]|uniref:34396_t:CDS:1 n=1 Tax=Racocetra persica TaxID=160502 RepID=A0ACA9KMC3_9GLOM|nr:34396_t:CDS:2 [Racocetra persica]
MFSDIFSDDKTTEPRWFKNIRIIVAIGLSVAILCFISNQFKDSLTYFKNEQYGIITTDEDISFNASMPGMNYVYLCSSNVANYSINYFTGSPFYTNISEYYSRGYSNKTQSDKEGCMLFQSGYLNLFPTLVALFDITLSPLSSTTNSSFDLISYLNNSFAPDNVLQISLGNISVSHNSTISDYLFAYNFTFESEDCALINFSPTINNIYRYKYSSIPFIGNILNFLMGFGGYSSNLPNYDLNPSFQIFPKLRDERRVQFAMKIPTTIRHETQISKFSCSLQTRLAKRYVSSSGIPLSQRVSNRRNNATLEDRVQMLETLLSECYLDNYQWETLRLGEQSSTDRLQESFLIVELHDDNSGGPFVIRPRGYECRVWNRRAAGWSILDPIQEQYETSFLN